MVSRASKKRLQGDMSSWGGETEEKDGVRKNESPDQSCWGVIVALNTGQPGCRAGEC